MELSHKSHRRKGKWRRVILLLGALCVISFCVYRFAAWFEVRGELADLRARGLPASSAELNDWYEAVPAEENAARLIAEAKAIFSPLPGKDQSILDEYSLDFKPGREIEPKIAALLSKYVQDNKEALEVLENVDRFERARFPIDLSNGLFTLLPHISDVKQLAWVRRWEALLASERGDVEAAIGALANGFAIARTLRDEPIQISDTVRRSCNSVLLTVVEDLLSRHSLTELQLTRLSRLIQTAENESHDAVLNWFTGERAIHVEVFRVPGRRWDDFARPPGTVPNQNSLEPRPTRKDRFVNAMVFYYRTLSGDRDRDLAFFLRSAAALEVTLTNGFPEKRIAGDRINVEIRRSLEAKPFRYMVSEIFMPSLTRGARLEAYRIARLRCAQTALAMERYRLDHAGALPPGLDQLVPEYLPAVPQDPFDGSSLNIQKEGESGYRVLAKASAQGKYDEAWRRRPSPVEPIEFRVLKGARKFLGSSEGG